jgi:hypothetical protein
MSTFNFAVDDAYKSISITSSTALSIDNSDVMQFLNALSSLNIQVPSSVVSTVSLVSTFTFKDTRSLTYTLILGDSPPASITFNISTTSYWNENEFNAVRTLAQSVVVLTLGYGMSAFTCTYV